jgi:hypothetical protein
MKIIEVEQGLWLPDRSLKLGAATSDRIVVASAASITTLDPWAMLILLKPTGALAGKAIATKGSGAGNNRRVNLATGGTTGNLETILDRTSDLTYTSDPFIRLNRWSWVGATFSSTRAAGDIVRFYGLGEWNPNGRIRRIHTATAVEGSGSFQSDAGVDLPIGNNSASNNAFAGNIAMFLLFNRSLEANELEAVRRNPFQRWPGAVVQIALGNTGTGTQLDRSGNSNNGTITGATLAAGPASSYMNFNYPSRGFIAVPLGMMAWAERRLRQRKDRIAAGGDL